MSFIPNTQEYIPYTVQDPVHFGRVAVLMGGQAAEREISLNSGGAVLQALLNRGVKAVGLDIHDSFLRPLIKESFDRVFNSIHGRGGEDGVLQGALEAMGLPYTGSGVLASALAMDKLRTKWCWLGAGLSTPHWVCLEKEQDIATCEKKLGFPVIVKPSREGSSIGMSRAENVLELQTAWKQAAQYDCPVFAEAWITGREYTVGMLKGKPLPLIRLETPRAFYDFTAKYRSDSTQYHCPCGLSEKEENDLQSLAIQACDVLGITGWARIDLLIDEAGIPWLIEANTVPGMTSHSLVPMAARAAGIDFDSLVWHILETSMMQG